VNGTTQADVTYDFALTNGPTNPAIAGSDFTNAPTFSNEVIDNGDGTITVPAGVTGFTVSYPTSNDTILENNETTELTIDGVAGTGTIKDALDAIPVVSIKTADGADTAIEGVADDTIVFEIFQTGATDKDSTVTVKLDLPGGIGGAVAADILDQEVIFTDAKGLETTYTVAEALAGIEVTIPAVGATNNPTFTITPANDGFYEVSEVLGMSITGAVNATVNTDPTLNSATGTILDESDDPQNPAANTDGDKPTLTVGNASATEGDNLVHQVTVNGTTQADVTYDFALTNGPTNPAIAGSDFTNAPTFSNEVIDN
ncbi:hypothetical protein, partial [Psychrobacter piscatorii]|uniref:hypothetical protein n=2 Tax=Psychrobacter TaxID=497 RepID=UPI001917FB02